MNKLRIKKLKENFVEAYQLESQSIFSSPGRIELLGNHTDHNHGNVLVAAIDLDILCAVKLTEDEFIMIKAKDYEEIKVNITNTLKNKDELSTSNALVRGILAGFKKRKYKIGSFIAFTDSTIFKGAGVSSSAAFELLICEILNVHFNNGKIYKIELAKIAQEAESHYFGKPCGLLDQMGIALGGINYIDFSVYDNPIVKNISFDFKPYKIVLVNTGGNHCNLTHLYSQIKKDMHSVANFFKKNDLRDVLENDFRASMPKLFDECGGRAIMRALHFFQENRRVLDAFYALKINDIKDFMQQIIASGNSSFSLLQNCYYLEDSRQGIVFALYMASKMISDGGYRVHGGGFAGTILTFVHENDCENYLYQMQLIFGNDNCQVVNINQKGVTQLID